jgi:hypothetical protein
VIDGRPRAGIPGGRGHGHPDRGIGMDNCMRIWAIQLAPLELECTGWTSRYYRQFPERTTPEPGMISWTGSPRTRLAMRIWSNCAGRKDLFVRRVQSRRPPTGPVAHG